MTLPDPKQSDVWLVSFDPTIGREIQKTRPAVVINNDAIGKLPLRMVVPITHWQSRYSNYPWFVFISANDINGLSSDSGADAFQLKSLSIKRFTKRLGSLQQNYINAIRLAITLCIQNNNADSLE